MLDITMCANSKNCVKKKSCYRATAKPSESQSYADFWKNSDDCDYFWFNGIGNEKELYLTKRDK